MATDYQSLLAGLQSGLGSNLTAGTAAAQNAVATPAASSNAANTGAQSYLDTYNANREQQIRDMYAGSLASQKAQLQSGYDQSLSAAEQAREQIAPQYQESRNEIAAEYERQRRNNNMQAAANGINTGANSQMQLAQSSQYQSSQAANRKAENQAMERANQGIVDLKTNYQNQISEATAKNDYQMAAALLDEYGAQYDRQMSQAAQLAEFGDFSMYASIYGQAAADNMARTWAMQNPEVAYGLGRISADEYFNLTGKMPGGSTGLYGFGGGGGRGGYGGGGYSSGSVLPEGTSEITKQDLYQAEAMGYSPNAIIAAIQQTASNPTQAQQAYHEVMQGQVKAGEDMWKRNS